MIFRTKMTAAFCCLSLAMAGCDGGADESGSPAGDEATGSSTTAVETKAPAAGVEEPAGGEPQEAAGDIKVQLASWEEVQGKVAEHKGKVVVLDAWSTSCGPCMKEFPNLVALHNKYQGEDVVCMSMSVDYDGIPSKPPESYLPRVEKFLTKVNSTLDNYLLNEESTLWYDEVELAAIPAVFVYGRDGELKKRFDNDHIAPDEEAFTYEDVNKLVEELLAE